MSRLEAHIFSSVGVVEGKGFQGGTGVLVGNCGTLVTAAHTIATEKGLRTWDVAFLHRGDPAREFAVDWERSYIPPIDGFLGRSRIQYDIAVLALRRPVPDCLPLDFATLSNDGFDAQKGRIYSVSFHRDTGQDAVVHRNCSILNNEVDRDALLRRGYGLDPRGYRDSVLLHDCDTGAGSSGSPLMIFAGGKPYVIGINTGALHRADRAYAAQATGGDAFLPERLKRIYPNHGVLFTDTSPVIQVLDGLLGY